jgi:hypothetical protein
MNSEAGQLTLPFTLPQNLLAFCRPLQSEFYVRGQKKVEPLTYVGINSVLYPTAENTNTTVDTKPPAAAERRRRRRQLGGSVVAASLVAAAAALWQRGVGGGGSAAAAAAAAAERRR